MEINRDRHFSQVISMNICEKKPEDVIKPEFLEKYKELHEDILARLIHTNTTITILEKILQYPFKYFSASQTIFWRTIFWNFAWVSVILIYALTDDKKKDVHTLPKFKNKVRIWLKDTEKVEFSRILKEHRFDPTTKNILDKTTDIRTNLMAHRLLDKFDHLLHSKAVTVSEIRYVYNNIEKLFQACSFGIEYDTSLLLTETENIDHILDLITKASLWLNQPELMGEQWPNIRQDTSEEELRDLNTWRKKFSLPPA